MTRGHDEYDLKHTLDELRDFEGRGTELISLYVPPGTSLSTVREQIATEYAQAENIKSDRTQAHVQDALNRVKSLLQRYQQTPEHGLAIFAGIVDEEMVDYVFDSLPKAIPERNYICSDTFETGPLETVAAPSSSFGLIALDRNEATIGTLAGERITVHHEFESHVMGKSKAGGQSQVRFERERERQKHEFFQKVAGAAKDVFIDEDSPIIDGLLIGGTTITVDDFISNEYLDYRLDDALLGTYGLSYGNKQALEELVRKADDTLSAYEDQEAKQTMDLFFDALSDASDTHATYGPKNVKQALQYGAVDTLLLSETLSRDEVDEYREIADKRGSDITFIPNSFDRGEQLVEAFGGVAALLRYDLHIN